MSHRRSCRLLIFIPPAREAEAELNLGARPSSMMASLNDSGILHMKTKPIRIFEPIRLGDFPSSFSERWRRTKTPPRAVTLIEMLVGIAIIAILIAILVPSMAKIRESGRTAQCVGNQKQLMAAIALYAADNDGRIPLFGVQNPSTGGWLGGFWEQSLAPYIDIKVDTSKYQALGDTYFRCPSAPPGSGSTYGVNYPYVFGMGNNPFYGNPKKLANLPSGTAMTTDVHGFNGFYSPYVFPFNSASGETGQLDTFSGNKFNFAKPRHNGSIVCSFADGRVEKVAILDFIENKNGMWGPIPEF